MFDWTFTCDVINYLQLTWNVITFVFIPGEDSVRQRFAHRCQTKGVVPDLQKLQGSLDEIRAFPDIYK